MIISNYLHGLLEGPMAMTKNLFKIPTYGAEIPTPNFS
jgi:hypothetical protein